VLRDATDRLLARRQTIDEPPHPDDTPLTVEGLELMQAFRKVKAAEDRQNVMTFRPKRAITLLTWHPTSGALV
jgi:hypothetical protein